MHPPNTTIRNRNIRNRIDHLIPDLLPRRNHLKHPTANLGTSTFLTDGITFSLKGLATPN
jgi:hypothetical protein